MGSLRLLLALLVLASHTGVRVHDLNPGVCAVVMFYAISGYVMSALIAKHYPQPKQQTAYYLDRWLRLLPPYLALALITLWWQQHSDYTGPFLQHTANAQDLINNLFIVPLNYFMFNGADHYTLIPPAWSLGVEIQFYLLAPWLWRSRRLATTLGLISLSVQMLSWTGQIDSDIWGYRLLPGTLWIFLLGMALQQSGHQAPRLVWGCSLLAALAMLALHSIGQLHTPYHLEVLLGVALALPLIAKLSRPIQGATPSRWRSLDEKLGNLSYGIFLNHFLLLYLWPTAPNSSPQAWLQLLRASLLLSWLTQTLVEQPVMRWRRRWRQAH